MRLLFKNRCGFTLIELLVVISIVSVLLAVLLPSLRQAREVAKSANCLANQRSIAQLVDYYANDYKDYVPTSSESISAVNNRLPSYWFSKLCLYYLDVDGTPGVSVYSADYRIGDGRGPERVFICPMAPEQGRNGLDVSKNIGYGWNYLALTHLDMSNLTNNGQTARRDWIKKPSLTIFTGDSDTSNSLAYVIKPVNFAWWSNPAYPPAYRHLTNANFSFADGHAATHTYEQSGDGDALWRMDK